MGRNNFFIKLYMVKIFHHNLIFTLQWWSGLKQEINGFPLVLVFCPPLFLCVHNFVGTILFFPYVVNFDSKNYPLSSF
jgi:hypothetical protein